MASVSDSSKLLENVQQICDKKFSKRQAELVKQFSELIYSSVSEYEFSERSAEEYFNSISSLWSFIQDFDGSSKVRVYNPDLKNDGWESRYTIIEVNHKDMPFLVDSIRMELNRHGIDVLLHIHVPMYIKRTKNGKE